MGRGTDPGPVLRTGRRAARASAQRQLAETIRPKSTMRRQVSSGIGAGDNRGQASNRAGCRPPLFALAFPNM
ncbi:hypothetical protein GCM10009738_02510 [Kitasatospora viridis]